MICNYKNAQYLYVFQGVIMARLKSMQNYYSFQHVKRLLFLLDTNTVIWTLSLSGTQHKYLCLCFMHSTIICSTTCDNFPAVSKTIIKATRTLSFASLRINCDDIPTNPLNILIMNSFNLLATDFFSNFSTLCI